MRVTWIFAGFLGKSLTRHLNRIWNYFCKGAIGTVGLTLTFPVLCVVGSTLSIVAAVLVPAWLVNLFPDFLNPLVSILLYSEVKLLSSLNNGCLYFAVSHCWRILSLVVFLFEWKLKMDILLKLLFIFFWCKMLNDIYI